MGMAASQAPWVQFSLPHNGRIVFIILALTDYE